MKQTAWEACNDPGVMLAALRRRGRDRKLRLFACACARRVEALLAQVDSRLAGLIQVAESYADGQVPLEVLQDSSFPRPLDRPGPGWADFAWGVGMAVVEEDGWNAAFEVQQAVRRLVRQLPGGGDPRERVEMRAQVELLRDLLATLYRPKPNLSWLIGPHFDLVTNLAAGLYRGHAFADLPVLADALEEAGCPDEELLAHCRQGGLHARGCYVVDALLGKE